jgi:hypothetical protein
VTDNFEACFFYYPNYFDPRFVPNLDEQGNGIVTTVSYDDVIAVYNQDNLPFTASSSSSGTRTTATPRAI